MILFGARDAGPAKYLSLLAQNMPCEMRFIGSATSTPVFQSYSIERFSGDVGKANDIRLIVTGTCLGDGLDKELVVTGKSRGIPTIAIVDHWTFMEQRFIDSAGCKVVPDEIIVNDEFARGRAIKAGLAKKHIHALGNPVLESGEIKECRSKDNSDWDDPPHKIAGGKTILFVSEQLSLDYENNLYNSEGYDEFEVLEDICSVLTPKDSLEIKLHPQESRNKYDAYLSDRVSIVDSSVTLLTLLLKPDFVIGMRSMLLLEASNIRHDIISYRPRSRDSFIGNQLRVTFPVENRESLERALNGDTVIENRKVKDLFLGSIRQIQDFILGRIAGEVV